MPSGTHVFLPQTYTEATAEGSATRRSQAPYAAESPSEGSAGEAEARALSQPPP